MLVLTRKIGERVAIGDDVEVVVQRVTGGRVLLGVQAPRTVSIRRDEVPCSKDAPECTKRQAGATRL